MELSPFWEANSCSAYSRISQHFVKPKGSLSCSQEPATGPYPEPDESNIHTTPFYFSKIHPNIILTPTSRSSYL
jgi:hypothetical protein